MNFEIILPKNWQFFLGIKHLYCINISGLCASQLFFFLFRTLNNLNTTCLFNKVVAVRRCWDQTDHCAICHASVLDTGS